MMIKPFLLGIVGALTLPANAQFFENFNGEVFPPTGWSINSNNVGSLFAWQSTNATPYQGFESTPGAFVNRENIGLGFTSQDWLITPMITIGANEVLSFLSRQTLILDSGTVYEVRFSTYDTGDIDTFTTLLEAYTETELGEDDFLVLRQKTIELNAFAGQTGRIAFVRIHTQPTDIISSDRWIIDNVYVGSTLSTDRPTSSTAFTILPNPVENALQIAGINKGVTYKFTIYNSLGQKVLSQTGGDSIDVSALAAGCYALMVESQEGTTAKKFIKS